MVQELVEAFLNLIKWGVLAEISGRHTDIRAMSSFGEEAETKEIQTRSKRGKAREWVAFSFGTWNFWDLHLGVVFDKESKHVGVGIHISESAWVALRERVEQIPWEIYARLTPRYIFRDELGEHRFEETEVQVGISNIGSVLQEVIDKTILYYEAVSKTIRP